MCRYVYLFSPTLMCQVLLVLNIVTHRCALLPYLYLMYLYINGFPNAYYRAYYYKGYMRYRWALLRWVTTCYSGTRTNMKSCIATGYRYTYIDHTKKRVGGLLADYTAQDSNPGPWSGSLARWPWRLFCTLVCILPFVFVIFLQLCPAAVPSIFSSLFLFIWLACLKGLKFGSCNVAVPTIRCLTVI